MGTTSGYKIEPKDEARVAKRRRRAQSLGGKHKKMTPDKPGCAKYCANTREIVAVPDLSCCFRMAQPEKFGPHADKIANLK